MPNAILKNLITPILSILLTGTTAFGSEGNTTSTICAEFKNIQFVSISGKVEGSCEDFKVFDEIISAVQVISPVDLKLGSLVVSPKLENNFGSENWELSSMTIAFDGLNTDWHRATLLIFPHEVGHLILDKFLTSKIAILKDLDVIKQRNATYWKHLLPILQLRQKDASCSKPDSECSRQIKKMLQSSPVDLTGPSTTEVLQEFFSKHKQELETLDSVLVDYHELFGDFAQAIYFDDPAVNLRASELFQVPKQACRTFNMAVAADFKSSEPHCRLSSIRTSLWENFVNPERLTKKQLLGILAEAIYLEVESRLNSPKNEMSNSQIATQLLRRFAEVSSHY